VGLGADGMSFYDRLYKIASVGFAAFGVFLLAKRALDHFLQKKRQHEFHRKYGQTSVSLFSVKGIRFFGQQFRPFNFHLFRRFYHMC
jgi:hypothetical protein